MELSISLTPDRSRYGVAHTIKAASLAERRLPRKPRADARAQAAVFLETVGPHPGGESHPALFRPSATKPTPSSSAAAMIAKEAL